MQNLFKSIKEDFQKLALKVSVLGYKQDIDLIKEIAWRLEELAARATEQQKENQNEK